MISEKTDPVVQPPRKPKFEQLRADHELFLQAFEKPTQIYRFLATRNAVSPIFLHRTLDYMKHRRTTIKRKRKDFKVDGMLEKAENKVENKVDPSQQPGGFLNLTFSSFFFGSGPVNGDLSGNKKRSLGDKDFVDVEVSLVKISHKKRKENEAQVNHIPLGEGVVPFNPRSQLLPMSSSCSMSIPNSMFKGSKSFAKTSILTLQVSVPYKVAIKGSKRGRPKASNGDNSEPVVESPEKNGTEAPAQEDVGPPAKRLRTHMDSNDENTSYDNDEKDNGQQFQTEYTQYTAELIMFDTHRHCLLTDGIYELTLQERNKRPGRKRGGLLSNKCCWENIFQGNMGPFDVFAYGPTLKFKLSWSGNPVVPVPQRPTTLPLRTSLTNKQASVTDSSRTTGEEASAANKEAAKKKQIVYYQFIYNHHTRQQTEARNDFTCPWCHVNCHQLYNLLKHLKLCHGRFTFTYAPHAKGARIDVCVNEHYDGSYAGKMEDFSEMLGYAFSREGPCRRVTFNHVLSWRPQRRKESLSEFLEPDDMDVDGNRPYHSGHNRLYFHAETYTPISKEELGSLSDSEGEENPDWMKARTIQMIDDFTDVNSGEKDLMKLWNIHLMEKGYIADAQVYNACVSFLDTNAKTILSKNLKRNFLVHLVSLHDFNLLNGGQITQLMQKLRGAGEQPRDSPTTLADN